MIDLLQLRTKITKTCALFVFRLKYVAAIFILFNVVSLSAMAAKQQCSSQIRGINLAGAAFAQQKLPGINGRDYKFPSASNLQYYGKNGFNATRLSLLWERLQPSLFGELDPEYSKLLLKYMDDAKDAGQVVVIDIHNYNRYKDKIVGSENVAAKAFKDLWMKIALLLKDHPALYAYGLMNEPHHTTGLWHTVAQFGVDGVRSVDSKHLIYVAGDDWSSAASWPKSNPKPFVKDTSNLIVYEAHVYFDDDFSGRYQKAITNINLKDRVEVRIRPFIDWLKLNKAKGVIGEWGMPTNDLAYSAAVDSFIDLANTECLDWFVWAGGSWSSGYNLSLEPIDGQEKPLLKILRDKMLSK